MLLLIVILVSVDAEYSDQLPKKGFQPMKSYSVRPIMPSMVSQDLAYGHSENKKCNEGQLLDILVELKLPKPTYRVVPSRPNVDRHLRLQRLTPAPKSTQDAEKENAIFGEFADFLKNLGVVEFNAIRSSGVFSVRLSDEKLKRLEKHPLVKKVYENRVLK